LVGAVVGESVGEVLGALVGDVVGEVVGALIGEVLGALVGGSIGDAVGPLVGDVVGESVSIATTTMSSHHLHAPSWYTAHLLGTLSGQRRKNPPSPLASPTPSTPAATVA
jgi:uncharacterized protein YqgC (DUF456 family)